MEKNLELKYLFFSLFWIFLVMAGLGIAEPIEIVASPEKGVSPLNVSFKVSPSEGIIAYAWDFEGDGEIDSEESEPAFVYIEEGTFKVTAEVERGNETLNAEKEITVEEAVKVSITANPTQGEAPLAVQFTAAAVGKEPLTYAWDFNEDGVVDSTLQNPAKTFERGGEQEVRLKVTDTEGNEASRSITITAIVYETKLSLASYFPKKMEKGDQDIVLIIANEGNNTLKDVKARIIGEGIQQISSTTLDKLEGGEQDSLTVKVKILQSGTLAATAKVAGENFPISLEVVAEVSYDKGELEKQLNELKEKLQAEENIYYEKKAEGYLVAEIFERIKEGRERLEKAQEQLMKGSFGEAKINLDLVGSSLEDITANLKEAKKQKTTLMMWLKDNALAITAVIAALGALSGILVKVIYHAKKVGAKVGENIKQRIVIKKTVTENTPGSPVKEVVAEITEETITEEAVNGKGKEEKREEHKHTEQHHTGEHHFGEHKSGGQEGEEHHAGEHKEARKERDYLP